MDYTQILNDISSKLSSLITLVTDLKNDSINDLLVLLFAIYLVLWIMRGE